MLLVFITAIAHLLSALRLACYRRDEGSNWRRNGLMNSLCGGAFCLAGMDLLLTAASVSPWHAGVSVLACALIIRSGGNIMVLWRAVK
ncbi:phage holin family protein [Pseudomonas violetae]|uniref:Phage holin family protein n=1 Tax=Pseudomonas violetae TaxID=2915813 RepID=A0ABT0EV50_9PSED|nr:phage holin family protein [Pseudomonas violetae]MCK1789600.1 phage holin family protein [Pseudomonas violetae]